MTCPPSKRLRGLNHDAPKSDAHQADPFGDDFTQDDLEEIDIMASQAIMASQTINVASLGSGNPVGGGARGDESGAPLEAQRANLRRKLKEVEDEIVSKNGEIRMLRDSLRRSQQEKETQRHTLALLEKERQREQSDKEKELSKKVQSLKTELQFKEAEINGMRGKLLSVDRNKPVNSPKRPNGLSQLDGAGGASPKGSGFITKETFAAQLPSKKASLKTRRDGAVDKQEVAFPDPFPPGQPPHQQHPGGVLLGLLLQQQPLFPSSLCLSHLMSMSLSDAHCTARGAVAVPRASLGPVQSLAITGLNMLSQSRPAASGSAEERGCPGAVLLLPLLDTHLSRLCRALDARDAASGSRPDRPPVQPGMPDQAAASGVSAEDAGSAALRILYLLIDHSDEVVLSVLATYPGNVENETGVNTSEPLLSHNALLPSVLHLCRATAAGKEWEEIAVDAVKAASLLLERAPDTHVDQLPRILRALCECVSAHDEPRLLARCAAALACACDHPTLLREFCSRHEPCVTLKLLQHVRNRTGKQAPHDQLVLLDLQVVRLLNRLAQTEENWQNARCPCYTEVVETTVVLLHRQWLSLRDSPAPSTPTAATDTATRADGDPWRWPLLRECVLLLQRLLQHHAGFSASCRPVLHMYGQLVPALKDTLGKIHDLTESEELALEEICRPEGDDNDDMDAYSGS
ncbi:ATR-interacting protein [Stigmatopora argus]